MTQIIKLTFVINRVIIIRILKVHTKTIAQKTTTKNALSYLLLKGTKYD